jgi:hypothetical protein
MSSLAPLNPFVLVNKGVYVSSRTSINTAQYKKIAYDTTEHRNDRSHCYLLLGAKIVLCVTESGDEKLRPECLLSMETLRPTRTLCASLQLQDS